MRVLLLVVVALAACPGAQKLPEKPPAPAVPAIAGKFTNDGCLTQPNTDGTESYLTITYTLNPTSWAEDIVVHGDEKCAAKQGTIHMDGSWNITGPSKQAPGAFDAELAVAHRTVTPHVDGYISLLMSMSCGKAPYAVNEPQDILAAGCKDLGYFPSSTCIKDYELVQTDGNTLAFGKRAADNDACTPAKRPAAVSSVVLKRR